MSVVFTEEMTLDSHVDPFWGMGGNFGDDNLVVHEIAEELSNVVDLDSIHEYIRHVSQRAMADPGFSFDGAGDGQLTR